MNTNNSIEQNNTKTKSILKNSITFVIITVSVYFAFAGINYYLLWHYIITANFFYILLPIPVMIISHWIRAIRWKTLLKPIHQGASIRNLFASVMIGYAINNLLPRGGEIVRPYVFSKQENISFSSTFATIILERILDVLTLLILLGFTFLLHKDKIVVLLPTNIDVSKITYLIILLLVIIVFAFYPPITEWLINKIFRPFSNKFANKLSEIFTKFRKGFAIIKSPNLYTKIGLESLIIWFFYALPLYIMFYAFDFSSQGMNFWDAILLLVASGISFTVAPTPGSIGVFHWIVKVILMKFYGVNGEQALAYATVNHGINYLLQIMLGSYFIIKDRIWNLVWNINLTKKDSESF